MDAATLRFLLIVLALGVVAIGAGFAWTRMRERVQVAELAAPPDRAVPGLAADAPPPAYVPADVAAVGRGRPGLTERERADVRAAIDRAEPVVAVGWGDPRLVSDAESGLVVLDDARVFVVDDAVGNIREYLALVAKAGDRPLAVLAAGWDPVVVDTVVANLNQGLRTDVVLTLPSDAAADVAARVGTRPISRADLQSGWLPNPARAPRWVSDRDASWLVAEPSA